MKVSKDNILYAFRIFLIALILGTLAFIFVNSCLPPEVSSEESEAVGGFIASFIPKDTKLYDFVTDYIRKIAHFTEYGMLGIEIAVYIMLYCERRVRYALMSPAISVFVGLFDETIQIFSSRGPAIYDVWIDIGGFVFFSALAWGAMCLSVRIYKAVHKNFLKK